MWVKKVNPKTVRLAWRIVKELKHIGAYIYQTGCARFGGQPSVYNKFEDSRIGSIRIGDHKGREKYSYRFNLEIGGVTRCEYDQHGYKRWYYHNKEWKRLVLHIKRYYNSIIRNENLNYEKSC